MGVNYITQREVVGTFYRELNQDAGAMWLDAVSNYFTSDQDSEKYAFLGQAPGMREWVGGRNAKGFLENNITIANKHYEATMQALIRDLRRDKTGQMMIRLAEMARRTNSHWMELISTLIVNGPSTACYDGQYFWDTDHSEGDSGVQSNDISVDISGLPVATAGTVTNPAVAEAQFAIMKGVVQILGLKDDRGKHMNMDASSFLVMVPLALYSQFAQAVDTPVQVAETQSALTAAKKRFSIRVEPNPILDSEGSWTDEFVVFRDDSAIKSFIRQEEVGVQLKTKWLESEFAFDNDAVQMGVDTWRNVAYGYWQHSCLVTMT